MKIEGFVLPENYIKTNTANGSGSVDFEEGQILNARVLSCEKSVALLKTEAGYILRAKLDAGIILEQGSVVTLVATGHRDGAVLLKLVSEHLDGPISGREPPGNIDVAIPKDIPEILIRVLNKLELPVTKEIIEQISNLVKQKSDLSPEKIIFFAANNMRPDQAGTLFSPDSAVAKHLEEMIRLIKPNLPVSEQAARTVKYEDTEANTPGFEGTQIQGIFQEKTDLENIKGITVGPEPAEQGLETAEGDERAIPAYIGLNDIKESGGVSLPDVHTAKTEYEPETTVQVKEKQVMDENSTGVSNSGESAKGVSGPVSYRPVSQSVFRSDREDMPPEASVSLFENKEFASRLDDEAKKMLIRLIAKMPPYIEGSDYKKIPGKNAEKMAEVLNNVLAEVQELRPLKTGAPERLIKYLDDIFARLTGEPDDGTKLKKARDELYTKLVLLKEELSGAELSGKTELVEQAQKLINHIKAINDINQYVYTQIPIMLNGKYETAELYFFKKKKGGRKIDPENTKILLALDLENLGRFEGLVGIKGKEVSLRIEVSKDEAKNAFLQNTIKLHGMLAEIGYKLTNVYVKTIEKETTVDNAMLKLKEFEESIKSVLDMSI